MTPYVACMLVATGMLAHFGIMLVRFLRRRAEEASIEEGRVGIAHQGDSRRLGTRSQSKLVGSAHAARWPALAKWFPALVLVIFAGYVASKARMPESKPSEMQVYEFGKLPLAYQGRIKPYDTLARNTLQILSGKQETRVWSKDGKVVDKSPAIRWLLDAISGERRRRPSDISHRESRSG